MKLQTIALILTVPLLNIGAHAFTRKALTNSDGSFWGALFTPHYLAGFTCAIAIAFSFLAVYTSSGFTMSRVLLFIGGMSIITGSLFGVVVLGESLKPIEWTLFATLVSILAYRFFFVL
jgi:hypothetical protein